MRFFLNFLQKVDKLIISIFILIKVLNKTTIVLIIENKFNIYIEF